MAVVLEALNEYAYRKEFGLSYQEFVEEPFGIYLRNMQIMSVRAEVEQVKLRKMKRQAKI